MKYLALLLFLTPCLTTAQMTLREAAAQRSLLLGAAANADEFGIPNRLADQQYAGTLARHFNLLTAENAMKWQVFRPTRATYDFGPTDKLVSFAAQNRRAVRGHVLLWHNGVPDWLPQYAATASPSDMAGLLEEHIRTVVGRYKGRIFAWDVVNEAFNDPAGSAPVTLRDSIWHNRPGIGRSGTGFIEQAFRWANQADPSALLFYNDYSIEGPGPKFNAVLAMVRDFVARGVPIHGVGFQMHLDINGYPTDAGFAQNMRQITDLGLQVHITEMDVRVRVDNRGNATDRDLQLQAGTYERIAGLCLANPKCTALQTWGFTDRHSWVPGVFAGFGAALPFDANYQPKPAVEALLRAFRSVPPVLSANAIVNAASYRGGAVAPGELVTIFNARYGPSTLRSAVLTPDNKLASEVQTAKVYFDNIPAPLIYAVAGQVSAIVPYEVAGRAETVVQYEFNGVRSNTVTLPVARTAPGIFASDASGKGPGLVLKLDYSVVSPTNPARAGDAVLLLATGGGAISGGAVTGALAPSSGQQSEPVTATINGVPAEVLYAGPAPGLVNGVLQVNLTIPQAAGTGDLPLLLRVGGVESQTGITVSVR
ncbi:MAG TPA: endo-1,4-beta-xylanase [Bryobacteraceae bacterium]|nr:endo-1,4-beta-xylanase [Bryobacteraceae bacterium]